MHNRYCVCLIKFLVRDGQYGFVLDHGQTFPNPDKDQTAPARCQQRADNLQRMLRAAPMDRTGGDEYRKRAGIPADVGVTVEPIIVTGIEPNGTTEKHVPEVTNTFAELQEQLQQMTPEQLAKPLKVVTSDWVTRKATLSVGDDDGTPIITTLNVD